jgi:hypothetical protein
MGGNLFLLDTNLGLAVDQKPWPGFLAANGIETRSTTDLVRLDAMMAAHEPDIAFMPIADFHRLLAKGDDHYRGLAIATSKFTGTTSLPSVLVVRSDDPADSLAELEGVKYAYINKSCSSSYYSPAILLQQTGRKDAARFLRAGADGAVAGTDRCRGHRPGPCDHGAGGHLEDHAGQRAEDENCRPLRQRNARPGRRTPRSRRGAAGRTARCPGLLGSRMGRCLRRLPALLPRRRPPLLP